MVELRTSTLSQKARDVAVPAGQGAPPHGLTDHAWLSSHFWDSFDAQSVTSPSSGTIDATPRARFPRGDGSGNNWKNMKENLLLL
jgi:hypothetical protein